MCAPLCGRRDDFFPALRFWTAVYSIELDKFHTPNAIRFGPVDAPVNTLGVRRIMFAVDDIDAVVARLRAHGAELIGEMQYEDAYRLAYIRGPEGIIVALAEQLG
jgi:predicted enzyme related to lactoylglutathione lyase